MREVIRYHTVRGRVIRRRVARLGSAALACALSMQASAQHPTPATRPSTAPALADRQAAIRERLQRLEANMHALARLLAESEPAQAERLHDALDQSGQKQLRRRAAQLAEQLRQARFSDAEKDQTALLADLESVLTLLTSTLSDLDRMRAERERLETFRREVAELRQAQREQLYRTQAAISDQKRADELRAAAEQLERAADGQAELRGITADGEPAPADRAARQRALLDQMMPPLESLRRLSAETRESPIPALEAAQTEATRAAESMKIAAQRLEQSDVNGADSEQRAAEEELRRAVQRLREAAERTRDAERIREIERAQRQTEQRAAELEQNMQPSSGDTSRTPGRESIGNARRIMQRAADHLGEQQPQKAQPQQQQSLTEIQRAMDELDDALRQLRKEEMEETLTALSVRFKAMLAREERVQGDVLALDKQGVAAWTRSEQLVLVELAATQRELGEESNKVLAILVDEGSTVILPDLLRQLTADLNDSARQLDGGLVGAEAQAAIDDILATLREIVDAIDAQRDQLQQEPEAQPQDAQPEGREALLPGSAELKLLRASQVRISRRTAALAEAAAETPVDELHTRFAELAERQRQLAEMARRMNERK